MQLEGQVVDGDLAYAKEDLSRGLIRAVYYTVAFSYADSYTAIHPLCGQVLKIMIWGLPPGHGPLL